MAEYQYDIAILGGGPGGYVAAIKAAQQGKKVALVEKQYMGGTCLNVGCIPTKALLAAADTVRTIKGARDFGITVDGMSIDFPKVMARKDRVVKQLRSGVEFLMKKNAVTVYTGAGTLTGAHSIGVAGEAEAEFTAEAVILASGSVPSRPPIPGIDGARVVTSDEILFWPDVPKSLTVIGAGAIGLEFALFFNTMGSKVTVLEALPHVLPQEDEQIAAELAQSMKRQGVTVHAGAMVKGISDADGTKVVTFAVGSGDETTEQHVTSDVVLVATGRWPFTEGCGYEAQGIRVERRAVQVDEYLYTGVEKIYAIGDVIGGMLLAHKASAEAGVAVDNIIGRRRQMHYHALPTALYSHPEVASVGLHDACARSMDMDVRVGSFPFRVLGKALAIGEREGLVKVVVNGADGVVVGCQAMGPHVTDMIVEMTMAVEHRMTAEAFLRTIHPHPTLAEAFHEAVEAALGHAVHV
jgi:dihydrolipoamide dehydrogenase